MEQGHDDRRNSYRPMIRRISTYLIMLLAVVSCVQKLSGPELYGSVDLSLSADLEVDVATRSTSGPFDLYNISLHGYGRFCRWDALNIRWAD